ncbi:MAG: hypothetical protein AB7V46_21220, partial [Thermomicrobiales bacterium]
MKSQLASETRAKAIAGPPALSVSQAEGAEVDAERALSLHDWPYLLVDQVKYDDDAPWPATPDGQGDSLTR